MSKLRPSVNGSPDDVCERIAEAIAEGIRAQADEPKPTITFANELKVPYEIGQSVFGGSFKETP